MLILADAGYAITYGYRKETYIMKKKLSIILTLIMVLTMGITVSAAEDSSLLNNFRLVKYILQNHHKLLYATF